MSSRYQRHVYVAGAISAPDPVQIFRNILIGIDWTAILLERGFAPFCPFLDGQIVGRTQLSLEEVYAYSLSWLRRCDDVFLVPGWEKSHGTQNEIQEAIKYSLGIYDNLQDITMQRCQPYDYWTSFRDQG
jgi:hypothetical protein